MSREPALSRVAGATFEALADPHRRAIVEMLSRDEHSVKALADELPISRPAVSRHLRLLKEAGLVADRPDGTRRIYGLRPAGVETLRTYLDTIWSDAITRFTLYAENTTPSPAERP